MKIEGRRGKREKERGKRESRSTRKIIKTRVSRNGEINDRNGIWHGQMGYVMPQMRAISREAIFKPFPTPFSIVRSRVTKRDYVGSLLGSGVCETTVSPFFFRRDP